MVAAAVGALPPSLYAVLACERGHTVGKRQEPPETCRKRGLGTLPVKRIRVALHVGAFSLMSVPAV